MAAQKVFNIINTARRHRTTADFPPAALARLIEVLASDALAALGYSEAEIVAGRGGDEHDTASFYGESGQNERGRRSDDAALKEQGSRAVPGGGLADQQVADGGATFCGEENAMETDEPTDDRWETGGRTETADVEPEPQEATDHDMEITATEGTVVSGTSSDQRPGVYVLQGLPSQSGEDRKPDDELETLIFYAQQLDAKESQTGGWPIRLPKSWYWWDPKRAGRCIVRAALARDFTQSDFYFRTNAERSHSRGEVRLLHRSVVCFALWDNEFYGPPCATVAEAERAAFRLALDAYQPWIDWDRDS